MQRKHIALKLDELQKKFSHINKLTTFAFKNETAKLHPDSKNTIEENPKEKFSTSINHPEQK